MAKKRIACFICLNVVFLTLFACDGMAALFHGPKPEEPVPVFTVVFDANEAAGAAPSARTVNSGTVITMPGEGGLAKGADVFTGWNVSKSGGGTTWPPESPYTVTADQTFYAQWTDPAQVYTVTYNANGAVGTPPAPQKAVQNGSIITAGQGNLVNAGKTFSGWNTAADGTGTHYNAGSTLTVTADMTLYAQWLDPSIQRYTVTYHANGASGAPPSAQTVNAGSSVTLPGEGSLVLSGKTFNGWNTAANGSGTAYAEGVSFTVNGNTTLYAQWASEPVVPQGSTLAEKFAYIAGRADDGAVYDIEVSENVALDPKSVSTGGVNVRIILHSADPGDRKTISLNGSGFVFSVDTNMTLILEDVIIKGSNFNTTALIKVGLGGTLILNSGSLITENTNNSTGGFTGGGGIFVDGGTLTIDGGEVTKNKASDGNNRLGGGILVINNGALFLKNGRISNNEGRWGGGVCVWKSTFTMSGGIISGNKNYSDGAGAGIDVEEGTFTKAPSGSASTSGIIYGSSAGDELANIPGTNGGAAVAYYIGTSKQGKVDRTLSQFDHLSTINLNVGWE